MIYYDPSTEYNHCMSIHNLNVWVCNVLLLCEQLQTVSSL